MYITVNRNYEYKVASWEKQCTFNHESFYSQSNKCRLQCLLKLTSSWSANCRRTLFYNKVNSNDQMTCKFNSESNNNIYKPRHTDFLFCLSHIVHRKKLKSTNNFTFKICFLPMDKLTGARPHRHLRIYLQCILHIVMLIIFAIFECSK